MPRAQRAATPLSARPPGTAIAAAATTDALYAHFMSSSYDVKGSAGICADVLFRKP